MQETRADRLSRTMRLRQRPSTRDAVPRIAPRKSRSSDGASCMFSTASGQGRHPTSMNSQRSHAGRVDIDRRSMADCPIQLAMGFVRVWNKLAPPRSSRWWGRAAATGRATATRCSPRRMRSNHGKQFVVVADRHTLGKLRVRFDLAQAVVGAESAIDTGRKYRRSNRSCSRAGSSQHAQTPSMPARSR